MVADRQHLALKAPRGSTGCELGVANGGLTVRFLDLGHFVEFHAVDKWDDAGHTIHEYNSVVDRLKKYPEVSVWRLPATTYLKMIPDASLGFVYIDCYAHTGQDDGEILRAAWPKVQPGGLFAGDDYDLVRWKKTVRVVNQFAKSVGRHVHVYDEHLNSGLVGSQYDQSPSWYWFK